MNETLSRRTVIGAAVVVLVGAVLASVVFGGGQVTRILSTVGNSVGSGATIGTAGGDTGGATGGTPTAAPTSAADAGAVVPTLLIVRTGTLELTVANLDAAVRAADAGVARAGGYVSGSERSASSGRDVATVTYRIPSAAWGPTVDAIRGLATTIDVDQVKTDEVTGQVVDLTARIANLRGTEAALQAIMARATQISDVLDVQTQLTTTRGEIEKLVGEKAALVDQASFGSLGVTFRVPVVATPRPTTTPVRGWDPGDDVAQATSRLVRIGQASTSFGIWVVIVGLPIAGAVAIALAIAWQLVRLARWLARRRAELAGGA